MGKSKTEQEAFDKAIAKIKEKGGGSLSKTDLALYEAGFSMGWVQAVRACSESSLNNLAEPTE